MFLNSAPFQCIEKLQAEVKASQEQLVAYVSVFLLYLSLNLYHCYSGNEHKLFRSYNYGFSTANQITKLRISIFITSTKLLSINSILVCVDDKNYKTEFLYIIRWSNQVLSG